MAGESDTLQQNVMNNTKSNTKEITYQILINPFQLICPMMPYPGIRPRRCDTKARLCVIEVYVKHFFTRIRHRHVLIRHVLLIPDRHPEVHGIILELFIDHRHRVYCTEEKKLVVRPWTYLEVTV